MEDSDLLFDRPFEQDIRKATGLDEATVAVLAKRFEPIGLHFRTIIEATPTDFRNGPQDITPMARLKWVRNSFQRSLADLHIALSQPARLSAKPDTLPSELTETEWTELTRLLNKLSRYSDELGDCFEGRMEDNSTVNAELRFDLTCKLADACDKAGITVSRDHHSAKEDRGTAAIIIKATCKIICGATFSLDHHLRDYLALGRAKKPAEG